jgi:hypothetical protein
VFTLLIFSESTMSTPGATSGSQAAAASQSVGSCPPSCPRPAANSATPRSNSSAPARATVGNTDVVEIQEDVVVGTKRKLRSEVWEDFDLIYVKGVPKARCSWCKKELCGETRSGTTHLKNHLAICGSRSTRKGLTQSTLKLSANSQDGAIILEKYVFDHDVAVMIIVHEYPLSMVDHVGFHKFCAALQPAFKVVSRNTIRKDILDMYQV